MLYDNLSLGFATALTPTTVILGLDPRTQSRLRKVMNGSSGQARG